MNISTNPTRQDTPQPVPAPLKPGAACYGWMDQYAAQTWPLAIRAVARATDGSFENARAFLEGSLGEKFAHGIYGAIAQGTPADEAITQAMRHWFRHPGC
ncbi:hypothetical protein [Paraburkholderia adhaesiva]|uniref:hypothetical protein n=1 Tax=Paraburkholderia adhaesiva TaxID=2883244 RepID=UPI001F365EFD|nr:hypothetical protein [Paraburkholderia adhaesiva]